MDNGSFAYWPSEINQKGIHRYCQENSIPQITFYFTVVIILSYFIKAVQEEKYNIVIRFSDNQQKTFVYYMDNCSTLDVLIRDVQYAWESQASIFMNNNRVETPDITICFPDIAYQDDPLLARFSLVGKDDVHTIPLVSFRHGNYPEANDIFRRYMDRVVEHCLMNGQQTIDMLRLDEPFYVRGYGEALNGKTFYDLWTESMLANQDNTAIEEVYNRQYIESLLNRKKFDRGQLLRLSSICFTLQRFIYIYESSHILIGSKEMTLISVYDKYFILEAPAIALLNRFNGNNSLGSIYRFVKSSGCREYRILYLGVDLTRDKIDKCIHKDSLYITDFYSFIALVKKLFFHEIITLSPHHGFKPLQEPSSSMSQSVPQGEEPISVLLLGDTSGSAAVGILYLASYLIRHGVQARCIYNNEWSGDGLKAVLDDAIKKLKPQFIGISLKWFPHIARVLEICAYIKKRYPSLNIVLGGDTATYYHNELINYDYIDYIIRGDGEEPLYQLVTGKSAAENLVYKKEGRIIKKEVSYRDSRYNSDPSYLSHVEMLCYPAQNLFFNNALYVYCGKGCDHHCFYCAGSQQVHLQQFNRKQSFFRDPELVANDLRQLSPYTGTFLFDFQRGKDDTYEFYLSVFSQIQLSNKRCKFFAWHILSRDFIQLLSASFLHVLIVLDVPSLSERHRKVMHWQGCMKKQPSNEEIHAFMQCCAETGNVEVEISTVGGLPLYDESDYREGERLIKQLADDFEIFRDIQWERLHAQPGAPLIRSCNLYQMQAEAKNFESFLQFSMRNCVIETYPSMDKLCYPNIAYLQQSRNDEMLQHYAAHMSALTVSQRRRNFYRTVHYSELHHQAEQFAAYLSRSGVRQKDLVAICLAKSIDFVIAVLAIARLGATFMPLSLADTDQRILQTIQSAEVDYLITALPELTFTNTNNSVAVIDYHGCGSATQWTEEISKPDLRTPCYVIHTSGTTGNVKNVVIPQEGIENLSHFFKSKLQMTRHDIVGWFADLGFDASIWEILMALMSGSKLMVLEDYVKFDHQELSQFIDIHSITTITLPPSCSKVVAKNMSALKRVIFAGTTLYASDIQAIPQSVHVYNAYGPTETTICATIWNRPPNYNDIIPIGTPLPNMGVIITNRFGNPLPLMLAGEICIFGRGIADGYLNNPTLTQKAFAVYETESGEKLPLYRTGDIGRFLPDGEIEYLGRADRQIKRYGYRVHLQEIENALSKIPEMSNVAVVSDGRRVACFYKSDQVCNLYTVKQIACQYLSWYMIPDIWTRLDTIPRMSNDKVNYTLLREKLLQSGSDSLSEVENRNGKEQP